MPHSPTQRPMPGVLTVALVDALPLFRDGLSGLIQRTPGMRWVGAAERPSAALRLCERHRPNVVLIDSGLDPRNHLASMLLAGDPALALVVLIAEPHRNTRYLAGALAAGAHGVLLRAAEPGQILDAIRSAHTERRYVDPALAPILTAPRGRQGTSGSTPGAVPQPLSRREFQVLQLIADGLENQAIAKILFVSVETVRTHVKSILRKLAARDRTHAVAVAFRSGVLTPDTAEATREVALPPGDSEPDDERSTGA